MAVTRIVQMAGLSVTVRELTVAEVRDWAVSLDAADRTIDLGGEFAFDGVSLDDLVRMCDAGADQLDRYTPSELEPLLAACRELNPHFFRARAAWAAAQTALLRGILNGTSSPSPNEATA